MKKYWITLISVCVLCIANSLTALASDYTIRNYVLDQELDSIKATWDETEDSTKFKLQLYKGSVHDSNGNEIYANKIGNTVTSSGDSHDYTKAILNNGAGTYRFTIFAVQAPGVVYESEPLQVTYEMISALSLAHKPGWQYIDGCWFYYDSNGAKLKGWQYINDKWYYLDEDGICYLNKKTPDGYWVDASGAWDGKPATK